jgi:hypothetical protein
LIGQSWKDGGVIEQYVNWLISLYTARFSHLPTEPDAAAHAAAVLAGHAYGVPAKDEFLSLVASETADRLSAPKANPNESFVTTLRKAADAARHRVMREARRNRARLANPGQVPAPPAADDATIERVKAELLEGLSVEEHLIVEQLLAGEPVTDLARQLGVSRRTLYRRLASIRQRIDTRETSD